MRGGKADKGASPRKRPAARPTAEEKAREGPKRGVKVREWGAFETQDEAMPTQPNPSSKQTKSLAKKTTSPRKR
jgi:hypothetical protein